MDGLLFARADHAEHALRLVHRQQLEEVAQADQVDVALEGAEGRLPRAGGTPQLRGPADFSGAARLRGTAGFGWTADFPETARLGGAPARRLTPGGGSTGTSGDSHRGPPLGAGPTMMARSEGPRQTK